MAWCPFAARHSVALRDSQKNRIRPVGLVLHTAVSNRELVVPTGTTRWHFYCAKDGKLTQFFDTVHMAAAQLDGNEWWTGSEWRGFISVETWDGAGSSVWPNYNSAPDSGPAWTAAQVATLARLAAWLHEVHDIPLIKATGPRGTGIGYHRQFRNTEPYEWTSTHACPGSRRIAQVPGIIARAVQLTQEDDVPLTAAEIDKIATRVLEIKKIPNKNTPSGDAAGLAALGGLVSNIEATQDVDHGLLRNATAQLGAMRGTLDQLVAAVAAQGSVDAAALVAAVRQAAEDGAAAAMAGVVDVRVTVQDETKE